LLGLRASACMHNAHSPHAVASGLHQRRIPQTAGRAKACALRAARPPNALLHPCTRMCNASPATHRRRPPPHPTPSPAVPGPRRGSLFAWSAGGACSVSRQRRHTSRLPYRTTSLECSHHPTRCHVGRVSRTPLHPSEPNPPSPHPPARPANSQRPAASGQQPAASSSSRRRAAAGAQQHVCHPHIRWVISGCLSLAVSVVHDYVSNHRMRCVRVRVRVRVRSREMRVGARWRERVHVPGVGKKTGTPLLWRGACMCHQSLQA
jgi:hypothetical protein